MRWWRAAKAMACSVRSRSRLRLASPVSVSSLYWRSSCASYCFCSLMSLMISTKWVAMPSVSNTGAIDSSFQNRLPSLR